MSSFCLKFIKNTENNNPVASKASNGKTMILSKCATCGANKSRLIKKQVAKGRLTSVGFKTRLDNIPFIGDYLFLVQLR